MPLPSSLLNFLAAIWLSAGVNLLISGGAGMSVSRKADAGIWVLAAGFQAWAAHVSEQADREANSILDRGLTREEKRLILRDEFLRVSRRYWGALIVTGLSLVAAVLWVPGVL